MHNKILDRQARLACVSVQHARQNVYNGPKYYLQLSRMVLTIFNQIPAPAFMCVGVAQCGILSFFFRIELDHIAMADMEYDLEQPVSV